MCFLLLVVSSLHACARQDAVPAQAITVEVQPFFAAVRRLVQALQAIGSPLSAQDRARIEQAMQLPADRGLRAVQQVLDRRALAHVHINPESRVKVSAGAAQARLRQSGWSTFLVRVHNEAGITAPLRVRSPNAAPMQVRSSGSPKPKPRLTEADLRDRFLDAVLHTRPPMRGRLSGLTLEYAILQLYSRDSGKREATLSFDVGQGSQDLGFRNDVAILFDCVRAVPVRFEIADVDGEQVMASLLIRDDLGRVYPSPARRTAPDFFFHHQIYRRGGETVLLPPGTFSVDYGRGPEYLRQRKRLVVPDAEAHGCKLQLERWIDTAALGWISGDHHIHAAGCSHYESPAQGVTPAHMMRHILGEDLKVGCVLSWGPCWYYQKQFFEGRTHELSTASSLMRYDVEVSGFPSSHCGHLSLLRLQEDDYPGAERLEDWPSWDLPVLRWAKKQGAVVGFSHSGFGLAVPGTELPNYTVPRFDGIGANEYIVDVTHDAVDFISAVDTPATWELNIWYHTLNCGFRTRISGETDFPCIYGERVGLGRSYVAMPKAPKLDYDEWVRGIRDGRSYVSDGKSHLLNLTVGGLAVGERRAPGAASELALDAPGVVPVRARVAAYLVAVPGEVIAERPLDHKPFWDLERARIGGSRRVPVELVINGQAVARKEIPADGTLQEVAFDPKLTRSSWVALRIFPSSHTNPVFVEVAGKPIRASRRSAQWCLDSVEQCWSQKSPRIRKEELGAARAAYDHARERYRAILAESPR